MKILSARGSWYNGGATRAKEAVAQGQVVEVAAQTKKRTMSVSARKRIGALQEMRWATCHAAKNTNVECDGEEVRMWFTAYDGK
jgi:hypothetical protein